MRARFRREAGGSLPADRSQSPDGVIAGMLAPLFIQDARRNLDSVGFLRLLAHECAMPTGCTSAFRADGHEVIVWTRGLAHQATSRGGPGIGDGRPGRFIRLAFPITAFFVTPRRRPISAAECPCAHNRRSRALRDAGHSF